MKSRKKIILTLIFSIVALLIVVAGFTLANSNISESAEYTYEDNYSPTGDRTYVRLIRTANDKVDVYLEMTDTSVIEDKDKEKSGASVASFQIGLNIKVDLEKDENSAINFTFDDSLLNTDETYCKLRKTTMTPITETYSSNEGNEEPTTKNVGEKLHIFYVGTKELNDSNKLEGIKIGTISFDNFDEEETISIDPDSEFTKIAAINHNETKMEILPEDSLSQLIINPQENNTPSTPDDNETGDNETVNNETVNNETENNEPGNNEPGNDEPGNDEPGNNDPGDYEPGNGNAGSTDTPSKEDNSSVLQTGDIAIKLFVTLMIVSLIGIVMIFIIKKRKK